MNPLEELINDLERQVSINTKSIKRYCKQISERDNTREALILSYNLQADIIKISIIENWLPLIKENPIKANENLIDFIFREMYGLKSPHHALKTDRDRHYYLAQLVDLRHQLNNALDNLSLEDEMNPLENTLKELDVLFKETDKAILQNEIEELESILENTPEENVIDIQSIKSRLTNLKSKARMVWTQSKKVGNLQ